jgi:hypothetical protein
MPAPKKVWMRTSIPPKCTLSKLQKQERLKKAQQFVDEHYNAKIPPHPEPLEFNAVSEVNVKWHGAYIRFIATYLCPPGSLSESFEDCFARIGYFSDQNYNLWFRRHNDEWVELGSNLTLEEALADMADGPWFTIF